MYKKWADERDCGMLKIKNQNSKKSYECWLKHESHCGGHPFEIVFSWVQHGIHLYPPSDSSQYSLDVTNYGYAKDFIKMVLALIKEKVPFRAN